MPYLIAKIIMSLSAAALLGFLVAWWWTRLAERRRSNELEGVWTQKVQRANRELDALRADLRTEATRAQGVADIEMTFQAKLTSAENEVAALREKVAVLNANLATASKAASAAASKPGLEEEAGRLRAKVESLERDLAAAQSATDSAAAKARADAQASLANRDAELEQLRRKLEEAGKSADVIREKEDALANARKALNDRENELSQWKKKFSDLQSSQSQSASSAAGREAAKVKELEARYQGTIREKDAALARMLAQIGELEPLKGKIAESERLVAKAAGDAAEREAARIKELETRYQETIREKDAALARMLAQIGELEPLKSKIAESERLVAKAAGDAAEREAARIKELEARYQETIREKDAALARMLAQIGELEPLKSKIAESERRVAKAAGDAAEREAAKLKELEARYQETIREKDAALARMLAQIGELEPLKGRAAEAERLSAKLKELEQLTGLPARLAAAESRIATLIEERDAALQAAKASPSRSARPSKAADDSNDPNRPDDLKKIKGIGPVLEKKLASIGVVSFEQIARWTPDEADAVQKQLPELKDRIRRDNWVVAAREEFSRKYNREL